MIQMNNTARYTRSEELNNEKDEKKEDDYPSKKEIHPVLLIFYMISLLLLSSMQFVTVKVRSATDILTYVTFGISVPTFIATSCVMSKTKTQIVCLYFLIDNILFAFIMAAIGIVGLSDVIAREYGSEYDNLIPVYIVSGITVIILFLGIGAFRIMLLNGNWRRCHIVSMKVCLLISSIMYTVLAYDLIVNDWASSALKDFIFLYLFGMVATILELYGKLTDVDGTAELRYDYTVKKEEIDQEEEYLPSAEEPVNIQINETIHPNKKGNKK